LFLAATAAASATYAAATAAAVSTVAAATAAAAITVRNTHATYLGGADATKNAIEVAAQVLTLTEAYKSCVAHSTDTALNDASDAARVRSVSVATTYAERKAEALFNAEAAAELAITTAENVANDVANALAAATSATAAAEAAALAFAENAREE
jgi:hypothetical protein